MSVGGCGFEVPLDVGEHIDGAGGVVDDNRPALTQVTVTRLGITVPGPKFRLDVCGRVPPYGYRVSTLVAVAPTSVTFSTTALASVGIGSVPMLKPVTPVSCSFRFAPGPRAEPLHWTQDPGLVSRIRKGLTGT